ncbi:unnamed protein product [Euphydryas editha]|uniref:Uncharacterized protein n=1 Tax=Euphydryas editha TaxID=104508 RepID=A0AAU9V9J1_EUPED|nr:unnamed protein product [Euphydryas editha]
MLRTHRRWCVHPMRELGLYSPCSLPGCVFSIFFPIFILSGNEATPVAGSDCPLRLFSPVVAISNGIFRFVRHSAARDKTR